MEEMAETRKEVINLKRRQKREKKAKTGREGTIREGRKVRGTQKLEEKAATYSEHNVLFGVPNSFEFVEVDKARSLFNDKHKLWTLVHEWNEKKKHWKYDRRVNDCSSYQFR